MRASIRRRPLLTRYLDFVFFFGILEPALRASLSAIATACFRLFTFPPLPDFKLPCLYSLMTLCIFRFPLFFVGMFVSPARET